MSIRKIKRLKMWHQMYWWPIVTEHLDFDDHDEPEWLIFGWQGGQQ